MKKIKNSVSLFFIVMVILLTGISVLGIWDLFDKDVIWKSFETLGLLATVAVVVLFASKFINVGSEAGVPEVPNPMFKSIRKVVLVVLIASAALLALIGVSAIWDVILDKNVLFKSLASLALISFSSFIIVMTCLEREKISTDQSHRKIGFGTILLILFAVYIFFSIIGIMRF